jgi:signal transduction histidine kinase
VTERRLAHDLVRRFARVAWTTVAAYATVVIVAFGAASEWSLRRALAQAADVVESLLGLYADPGGERTTVAPDMLADQLVGMGSQFVITRTTPGEHGGRSVYFLTPNMPAKRIETLDQAAGPEVVAAALRREVAARGRWEYRLLHRRAGEFDIFVAASRRTYAVALVGVGAAGLLLLPIAGLAARRATRHAVTAALDPVERVRQETLAVGPDDLSRRVATPTGVAEVTEIAETINRLIERLERSHAALEAFTGDASHELRTPLTYLRAEAQWALEEGRSADERREALAAMAAEIERTGKLVEDLLLLARGDNRELEAEQSPFDLREVATEVVEITQAMAAGRSIEVRCDGGDGERVLALGDQGHARQVVLNLATNAVRYTSEGAVSLRLVRDDRRVGIAIADTGDGISEEYLDRIFDRFYRVDQSRSRERGGTGLGLSIARMLAEIQGGSIAVESARGVGSTFTLWLPSASTNPHEAPAPSDAG